MKKKKIILICFCFIIIVFAMLSSVLNINGVIKLFADAGNFDVYFSKVKVDNVQKNDLIIDDHNINFEYEFKKKGDTKLIEYYITNGSTMYDAYVSIACTESTNYLSISNSWIDNTKIKAQETQSGILNVRLIRTYAGNDMLNENISCTINASATSLATPPKIEPKDNTLTGIVKKSSGDKTDVLTNGNLVFFSDNKKISEISSIGRFSVSGLEDGKHEVYYLGDLDATALTKEEIIERSIAYGSFRTDVVKDELILKCNEEKCDSNEKYFLTSLEISETPYYTVNVIGTKINISEEIIEIKDANSFEIEITPDGNNYIASVDCTGGYTTNAIVGLSSTTKQKITIFRNDMDNNSECRIVAKTSSINVYFDGNGGITPITNKTIIDPENNPYGELPVATRDDYVFIGWYTDSENGSEVTSDSSITVLENQTLYAQWATTQNEDVYVLNTTGSSYSNPTKSYSSEREANARVNANSSTAGVFLLSDYTTLTITVKGSSVSSWADEKSDSASSTSQAIIVLENTITGEKEEISYTSPKGGSSTTDLVFTKEQKDKYNVYSIKGIINGTSCSTSAHGWGSGASYNPGSVTVKGDIIVYPDEINSTEETLYTLNNSISGWSNQEKSYSHELEASATANIASSSPTTIYNINDYSLFKLTYRGSYIYLLIEDVAVQRATYAATLKITLINSNTGATLEKVYTNSSSTNNTIRIKFTNEEKQQYDKFMLSGTLNGGNLHVTDHGWKDDYGGTPGTIVLRGYRKN